MMLNSNLDVSQKKSDCRKHLPDCTSTLKPGQKLHCLSQNLYDKDIMIKWHMDIRIRCFDLSEPMLAHQGRMHKIWGLVSIYI